MKLITATRTIYNGWQTFDDITGRVRFALDDLGIDSEQAFRAWYQRVQNPQTILIKYPGMGKGTIEFLNSFLENPAEFGKGQPERKTHHVFVGNGLAGSGGGEYFDSYVGEGAAKNAAVTTTREWWSVMETLGDGSLRHLITAYTHK